MKNVSKLTLLIHLLAVPAGFVTAATYYFEGNIAFAQFFAIITLLFYVCLKIDLVSLDVETIELDISLLKIEFEMDKAKKQLDKIKSSLDKNEKIVNSLNEKVKSRL